MVKNLYIIDAHHHQPEAVSAPITTKKSVWHKHVHSPYELNRTYAMWSKYTRRNTAQLKVYLSWGYTIACLTRKHYSNSSVVWQNKLKSKNTQKKEKLKLSYYNNNFVISIAFPSQNIYFCLRNSLLGMFGELLMVQGTSRMFSYMAQSIGWVCESEKTIPRVSRVAPHMHRICHGGIDMKWLSMWIRENDSASLASLPTCTDFFSWGEWHEAKVVHCEIVLKVSFKIWQWTDPYIPKT